MDGLRGPKDRGALHLRDDFSTAGLPAPILDIKRLLGVAELRVAVAIHARPVVRAAVAADAIERRGIADDVEQHGREARERHDFRGISHHHGLRVSGGFVAHVRVRRPLGVAVRVADDRVDDAGLPVERELQTPEAAAAEGRDGQSVVRHRRKDGAGLR